MRISSSNVDMYSERTYSSQSYESETTRIVSGSLRIPVIRLEPKPVPDGQETVKSEAGGSISEKEVNRTFIEFYKG